MAFRKQTSDYETELDLAAELKTANGDLEALMGQLLGRAKDLDTARKSFKRRASNPRNVASRPQLTSKADEALESKKRCDQALHALMHKVRAPGMKPEDWTVVEKALRSTRKAG